MSSVDVFVPCYRYGRFLAECVNSVLSQTGVEVRVLILDDASPDDTPAVAEGLRQDTRVHYARHRTNLGHIATYNEGLAWARARYLLLLSADDFLLPGALGRAVALLDEHPRMSFAFGNAMAQANDGIRQPIHNVALAGWRHATRVMNGKQFIRMAGATNIVPTPTAVVRTSVQQRIGGYRAELPHTGDMEMWLRLASHGDVGAIQAHQAVYRRHSNNMSHDYRWLQDLQQREAAIRCFLDDTRAAQSRGGARLGLYLMDRLSREALYAASAAFNEDQSDVTRQLMDYSKSLSPAATRSMPWLKMWLKQWLGQAGCRAVRAATTRLRPLDGRGRSHPN